MKPVFPWPGGKSWAVRYVLPRIRKQRHVCYCEPFGGGLAVLLAKELSKIEVVNDINSELINFYRCVRFHRDALIEELQWALSSREEFAALKKRQGLTDLQRAAGWFRLQSMSFGGDGDSYGVQRQPGGAVNKSRHGLLEKIDALNARLDKVNIENLDWPRCIQLYDSARTLFFVDPPYTGCQLKTYAAWSHQEMTRLRDLLAGVKGHWLLTVNDTAANRAVFGKLGGRISALKRCRGISNRDGKPSTAYKELLIEKR